MMNEISVEDILSQFQRATPLGEGGQKVVYRVDHQVFGDCVLKIGYYASDQELRRVTREVNVLKGVSSPYFPQHYAFELVDDSRYLIIEEYLHGETLSKRLADYGDIASLSRLMYQLVDGLRLLWDRRIVHRDVKPSNIVVSDIGPRIIDLGIARLLDSESLTHTFSPFGPCTPAYASPEQLENRKRDIDYRTDQFSLGIIAGQLTLQGAHPFDPAIVQAGQSIPYNIVSGLWAEALVRERTCVALFEVVQRLLGHQPYQRYRKVEDLLQRLDKLRGETL